MVYAKRQVEKVSLAHWPEARRLGLSPPHEARPLPAGPGYGGQAFVAATGGSAVPSTDRQLRSSFLLTISPHAPVSTASQQAGER